MTEPVPGPLPMPRLRYLLRVELLVRVLAFDLECARFCGPLRKLAVVTEREAAARVLHAGVRPLLTQ